MDLLPAVVVLVLVLVLIVAGIMLRKTPTDENKRETI